jgi:hypothetical protein
MLIELDFIRSLSIITTDHSPFIYVDGPNNIVGASFNLWSVEGFIVSLFIEKTKDGKLEISLKSLPNQYSPPKEGITLKSVIVSSKERLNTALYELAGFTDKIKPKGIHLNFELDFIKCDPRFTLVVKRLTEHLDPLRYDYHIDDKEWAVLGTRNNVNGLYPDILLKDEGENIRVKVFQPRLAQSNINWNTLEKILNRRNKEESEDFCINKKLIHPGKVASPKELEIYKSIWSTVENMYYDCKSDFRDLQEDFQIHEVR